MSSQQGFSTVELLISLFIAAAFIATGFQLFSVITNDSNEARLRAAAGSVVNSIIQEKMNAVGEICDPVPSPETISIPTSKLPQASADVTYNCPYGDESKTTRVKVSVSYGEPEKIVEGSLDVTKK